MHRPKASVHRLSTSWVLTGQPVSLPLGCQRCCRPVRKTDGGHCAISTSHPPVPPQVLPSSTSPSPPPTRSRHGCASPVFAVEVLLDPAQAADVEPMAGVGDGDRCPGLRNLLEDGALGAPSTASRAPCVRVGRPSSRWPRRRAGPGDGARAFGHPGSERGHPHIDTHVVDTATGAPGDQPPHPPPARTGLPESPVQVLRVASAVGSAHNCQARLGMMSRLRWASTHRPPGTKRRGTEVRRQGATPP